MKKASLMFAVLVMLSGLASAEEKEGVCLTVYPDFGVVRETRKIEIPADGKVTFDGVASEIYPTTVRFESLTDPAARILEQNYQYDVVDPGRLLEKYIRKPITVKDDKDTYAGELLSFSDEHLILKNKAGLVMINRWSVRNICFGAMPEGLRVRPTLLWKMATKKPGKHLTRVAYQTDGLSWNAKYALVIDQKDENADLSGWVSVENESGKTYRNAKLKFIAGDIQRITCRDDDYYYESGWGDDDDDDMSIEGMGEKAFFEYHMYTLKKSSTLANNEIKQLEMFAPVKGIKVAKKYLYDPTSEIDIDYDWEEEPNETPTYGLANVSKKVHVFVEFTNSKKNKLGIPLPAGIVRVYKEDTDDKSLELVGEEWIDHTPADETLSLRVGNAFDITGERKQTDFSVKIKREKGKNFVMSETIEVRVKNRKKEDVTVRIKEHLYRWNNWKIEGETHKRVGKDGKLDVETVAWDVPVKAGEDTVLTYTVEYTWPAN